MVGLSEQLPQITRAKLNLKCKKKESKSEDLISVHDLHEENVIF